MRQVRCMQAWRAVHPPKRGRWGRRPLAHMGFLKSWTCNDLNVSVTARVIRLLNGECVGTGGAPVRIIITGGMRGQWLRLHAPAVPSSLQGRPLTPPAAPQGTPWAARLRSSRRMTSRAARSCSACPPGSPA